VELSVHTTRYVRRTRNGQIVGEHSRRGGDEDVGEEELLRSPLTVDEALSYFDRMVLLGEPGSGKSFALSKLCRTLQFAFDNNDIGFIASRYPNWRHAPLPLPIRIDAPTFVEWLRGRDDAQDDAIIKYQARVCKKDFVELLMYCRRESFVLVVDDWGALSQADASRVNKVLKNAADQSKRYRATVIISAALDSAGFAEPFVDSDFERVTIAKLEPEDREDYLKRFCEANGDIPNRTDAIMEPGDSPGRIHAIIAGLRSERLKEKPDINVLHELELRRALELGWNSIRLGRNIPEAEASCVIDGVSKALYDAYLRNPSQRLLTFDLPDALADVDFLKENAFLRKHTDGKRSIRDYRLQDYLVGRSIAQSTSLINVLRSLFNQDPTPRREPVVHALLELQGSDAALLSSLDGILSSQDRHAASAIAEFVGSARRELVDGINAPLRKRICEQLVGLLTLPRGDVPPRERFHIGRALGLLGDPRSGTGRTTLLDLPEIVWRPVEAGFVALGQTSNDRTLYDTSEWPTPNDEPCRREPVSPFFVSKYLVTNSQFQAFLEDHISGYESPAFWASVPHLEKGALQGQPDRGTENHPVTRLTWDQARAFCHWYSRQTGQEVDLPSSVQWERAARGEGDSSFPFGDKPDSGRMNSQEEGLPGTTAVGAFSDSDSPFKVSDMSGNVFEWCRDTYDEKEPDFKVVKGGSYNHDALRCRIATRGKKHRRSQHPYMGFRLSTTQLKGPSRLLKKS
jgi:formylglycine-generating enzyme required for sulfatase activity